MAQLGNFALEGGDPRLHVDEGKGDVYGEASQAYTKPQMRRTYDSSITFEEYHYYALKTRTEEEVYHEGAPTRGILATLFPTKSGGAPTATDEKHGSADSPPLRKDSIGTRKRDGVEITDEEWTNASRALRTATASAIFYLITTDILGPFGLPYAFASMGWGPGVALFTVFAILAGYSGYLLWQIFMGMDSYEFPLKSYGDMGHRLYGSWLRYIFNFLQAIQLILNVGLIVVSNGEALSQAAKFRLCFAVCCLVWAVAGFIFGQVRTLQKFGWLANAAVWINLAVMGVSMYAVYASGPNYAASALSAGAALEGPDGGNLVTANAAGVYPAVQHSVGLPAVPNFGASVNGAMQAVFSYGGAMIFPEFMSEMRRPRDFLKGMWAAQLFIYVMYMMYGLYMYYYQGQYVVNPSYLGVSRYDLQTAGNVLAMVSALIAAALYGNIGVKVLYNNIFVEVFNAPPLTSKVGKLTWIAMIPVYWSIAFVIGAGIPDFSGLTGVVAALCILQFTYTFPPLLSVAYMINRNAMQEGEGFDPATGQVIKFDSGPKRWIRGFMKGRWYMNAFNILYCLGALTLAALGAYGAIENLIAAFASGTTNSFVCKSPLDGLT